MCFSPRKHTPHLRLGSVPATWQTWTKSQAPSPSFVGDSTLVTLSVTPCSWTAGSYTVNCLISKCSQVEDPEPSTRPHREPHHAALQTATLHITQDTRKCGLQTGSSHPRLPYSIGNAWAGTLVLSFLLTNTQVAGSCPRHGALGHVAPAPGLS